MKNLKHYVADALSLLRALSVLPVGVFAYHGWWEAAFVALILGWSTDMADGAAARKWGSLRDRKPSFDADGIADSVIAFGSTAFAAIYLGWHYDYGWIAGALWTVTLVVGTVMALKMDTERTAARRRLVAFNMVVFHGGVQIVATIAWYAFMAYGLSLAVAMVLLLTVLGVTVFGGKMRLWLQGEFAPPEQTGK